MAQIGLPKWVAEEFDGGLLDVSGPATADQIETAERELGVVFPGSYRLFLLNYGTARLRWLEVFGIPRDRVWGDLVLMNQILFRECDHCIVFGRDTQGNFYALDCSRQDDCPVLRLGADGGETVVAKNFVDFLRKIREGEM